jgi:fermentation-respiration switch protein FrsA (DUF1100 family)
MAPYVRVKSLKRRSAAEPSVFYLSYLMLRRALTPGVQVKFTDALPAVVEKGGYEIKNLLQDPELNFNYSYRFIIDIVAARNSNASKLADINIPTLVLHGRNDALVFPKVSEEFFKLIKSREKKLEMFDCDHWFYHAIFYDQSLPKYSEESRQQVIDTIANWARTIQYAKSVEKNK